MQRRDDRAGPDRRTGWSSRRLSFANSKFCDALKNGSYSRTGFPLLLKIIQPLPTQRGSKIGLALGEGARARPESFLDLAAEAIGKRKRMLDLRLLAGAQVRRVRLARKGVDSRRLGLRKVASTLVREQVVDETRRGLLRYRMRISQRVDKVLKDRGAVEIWVEALERVPGMLAGLAHYGGSNDHPQRVERDL